MKLKNVKQIKNLKNKKVILRADFNVPIKNGKILDDSRLKATLPTINYLLKQQASVIIMSHLGRPNGQQKKEFSNQSVARELEKLLKRKVKFVDQYENGAEVLKKELPADKLIMLENTRFHPQEKSNNKKLAKQLSLYGDIFVFDAFAVSHRAESSIEGLAHFLPSYAGLLTEKEVTNLSKVLESKLKPKLAVIGGAKLETKIKVIKNLLKKMDYVLVGGAIANNFIKALDYEVGKSLVDDEYLKTAEKLISDKLIIPVDVVVSNKISPSAKSQIKAVGQLGASDIILDLGPKTIEVYKEILTGAKMIVWNGPLGYFEIEKFKEASRQIAKTIAMSKAHSVVGGGETVQLINDLKLEDKFSFVSMAGGAMLEFLEGKILPGVKPLIKK